MRSSARHEALCVVMLQDMICFGWQWGTVPGPFDSMEQDVWACELLIKVIALPHDTTPQVGKKELSKVMQSGDEEEMRAQLALESGAGPAPGSGLGSSSSTGSTSSTSSTGSSPYSGQGGPGSPGQASGRTPPPPRS